MKESEIRRMPIDKIINQIGVALQPQDYVMSTEGLDIETVKEQNLELEKCPDKDYRIKLAKFLRENEKYLDKAAVVMLTLQNYFTEIKRPDYKSKSNEVKAEVERRIKRAKELLNGTNKRIYKLIGDTSVKINVLDSQELITQKKSNKNHQKLKKLEEQGIGLDELLNSIILTDLGSVVCEEELGVLLRYQAMNNTAIIENVGFENGKIVEPEEVIEELKEKFLYAEILPQVKEGIESNLEYLDFDKLVLCSAYRYIEYLDKQVDIKEEKGIEIQRRLRSMLSYLGSSNVKIEGRIEKLNLKEDEEVEYENVSYKVRDLQKDMEKFEGITYWGKARIAEEKQSLLLGEIFLNDFNAKRVRLSKDELCFLASIDDRNYMYLIINGLVNKETINKINEMKGQVPKEGVRILLERKEVNGKDIIELYLQGKVKLEDIEQLDVDFANDLNITSVYNEHEKENNDQRQERISKLYQRFILEGKNQDELHQNKENVYEEYLQEMNSKYLEIAVNLGALSFEDLDGMISSKEWIDALKSGEISEDFYVLLREKNLVEPENLRKDNNLIGLELKLWEAGKTSSQDIKKLGLDIQDLLKLCDEGKIKGTKIGELIPKEEYEKYGRKIESNFTYGMYDTIRPAMAVYNSDILSRDKAINIIKSMKAPSGEILKLCEEGLLDGVKIAELRYKGLVNKAQFKKLKENGFVSDSQEVEVANNLTPPEMLKELEENGCTEIKNITEILTKIDHKTTRKRGERDTINGSEKRVLNPITRNKVLELLGTDAIVTTPDNGFNGYQAFLIPKLGIAVLEKMFRRDKNGDIKPAYGDATYICEIGRYIQVAGQSKREIRDFMRAGGKSNGNVKILNHTPMWGKNLVKAVEGVNKDVKVNKKNGEIESVSKNEEILDIDIKELNGVVNIMAKGEASISLEEYE